LDSTKLNLLEQFAKVTEYFSPMIIGEVNDIYIKIAKVKGDDVPWHTHDNEDELFYIVKGCLMMELKGREGFELGEGELFVVEKGIEHRVYAAEECWLILIENKSTKHTGDVESHITRSIEEQKY
jgi:quercetin dioxygenase-like cupin family protein